MIPIDSRTKYNDVRRLFLSDQDPSIISRDCKDLQAAGVTVSGVYKINLDPDGAAPDLHEVYCDMDTDGGGWTV